MSSWISPYGLFEVNSGVIPRWSASPSAPSHSGSPRMCCSIRVGFTHGVGPMRTYRIGAILLDLDDPTRILGQLLQPLLSPATDEQDGYVPNVVYSCGALVHADTLVLPYGINDAAIGIATVPLPELLAALSR